MHPDQPLSPAPRRTRRRLVVVVLVVVPVLVAAAGVTWFLRRDTPGPAADAAPAVKTVPVVRTDLSVTESLTGTLGFGKAQPVKGGKEGIVTWLPRSGASVKRGQQLFRADDQPVQLFYGSMPLYRDLAESGTVGRDVRIVATNLKALGYPIGYQPEPGARVTRTVPVTPAPAARTDDAKTDDGTASDDKAGKPQTGKTETKTVRTTVRTGEGVLTSGLIKAVKHWQRDAGLPETGRIGVGDVVVLPSAVRVDSVTAQKGDSSTGPLLTVTSTAKVVTASAAVADAGNIRPGDKVSVVLPGDKAVPGEVSAVGTEVQPAEEGGAGTDEPKRSVTVTLDSVKELKGIDQANVQVDLAGETHEDVLAVPVGALVALSEGGYAVQLAGDRLVAVETGLFAKGLVEVTGDGVDEGVPVVTTS
ncbi:hypothetical protein [Actinoplanes sp. NPDC049265]|uniref:hypothetical protein n=1 Tax=Actinoplanes sp. NPDC049265 TaxID=3363902 RepID=UPI003719DA8A